MEVGVEKEQPPPAAEMASEKEELEKEGGEMEEDDPNLWVITDTTAYMEQQQSQGHDGASSSWLPSPQQPAQPVKKRKKLPWVTYKAEGFGSFFDTPAEIQHKACMILDLFPTDLDKRREALDIAIDPDEHLRYRRSNREVIRRRFDDYTDHLSDFDSFVEDDEESEEGEGVESEDEDYGTVKWTKKRKLADTAAPEDLPFKCPHCPRRFTRELYLKGHLVRHSDVRPYQCPHCQKAFGKEHHLKSHMTHTHPVSATAATTPGGGEGEGGGGDTIIFKCSLCGKGFPKITQLSTHIQSAHAAEIDISTPAPPTDTPLGEVTVPEGDYSSSSSEEEAALLIREDDDDTIDKGARGGEGGAKPQTGPVFRCPHCPRTFSREMYLTSHLDSHSENRPHTCPVCGKGFSRIHHLKSHMTHRHPQVGGTSATLAGTSSTTSVEPDFKCPCCRKSFRKDFHLKSHIYQKHRENKDAFEFLKQFTTKKRRSSSEQSFDLLPVSMETERSPDGSKPMVPANIIPPVSSEGSHFVFEDTQKAANAHLKDLHGTVPLSSSQLHTINTVARNLTPVFEQGIAGALPSGMWSSRVVSQLKVREEGDERPHKCPECGQGFARRSFLGSHIYQKHKRKRISSTDSECGSQPAPPGISPKPLTPTGEGPPANVTGSPTLSSPHMKEVNDRSQRVSSSTTISSDVSDEDSAHDQFSSTREVLNAMFKCPHCNRRFTRKAHLVSHVVAHSDERPYKCSHCEKAYGTGYHLKSHITYCHRSAVDTPPGASGGVFPFRCGECNESFPEHGMLRNHFTQSHSNSETNEAKSESGLHHVPLVSPRAALFSPPTGRSDGLKPPLSLPPIDPGVIYSSSVAHSSEDVPQDALMEREGVTTVVASGQIAPLESDVPLGSAVDDRPDTHVVARVKSIKCPHCPRTFAYSGHLSSHLVSHSNHRPFSCEHCNKTFAQRHHLKSHITHRHTKKPNGLAPSDAASSTSSKDSGDPLSLSFSCTECGKSFLQKNHLASHVYHKHPHARKLSSSSSTSSSREGGATGHKGRGLVRAVGTTSQVGGASSGVGGTSVTVGGITVQSGGSVVDRVGVSPVREGGAPSPGLKSPKELLGFMQSMTSGNRLADLDVGGRSLNLRESPFMKGSPSAWEGIRERPSIKESLVMPEGSRGSPSTREFIAIAEGFPRNEEKGDPRTAEREDSSAKRRKVSVALGYHTSLDMRESPQPAHLPEGAVAVLPSALQSTVTPPTKNMADRVAPNAGRSPLPQQPVTFVGGIPIVQTSFPAGVGRIQQNSPLIAGSSPGFLMLSAPQAVVSSHSLQQLSTPVQVRGEERRFTGLTKGEDGHTGTPQPRPPPSLPTPAVLPALQCIHCPRTFQQQAHLDAHQAAHRTGTAANIRVGSGLLAPLSHDSHMDSIPSSVGGATPPLSTGCYMAPPHPAAPENDQSASVGYPTLQSKMSTGSTPKLPSSKPKEEGMYRCPYCPLSFERKPHLASHLVSHENSTSAAPAEKPYKCPHCHKSCDTSRQLNAHIKKTHQIVTEQRVEKERLFKCDQCSKSFHQEHHLGVHVYLKHLSDETLGITQEGGSFPCVHCGRVFEYKHLLKSHMFHNHKGAGLRPTVSQSDSLANGTKEFNATA